MRLLVLVTAAGVLAPATVHGQVGHAPERSPYHDLRARQSASVVFGLFGGQRGTPKAGPAHGTMAGIRYDRQVSTPLEILLGLSGARLDRYIVDATATGAGRLTGPVKDDIIFMETGLSILLTGRKTWRGFAPYVGGMFGVAFETNLGFEEFAFATKGVLTPHVGIKWFPTQALAFKVEGRDVIWRLSYPTSWFTQIVTGVPPVLVAGTDRSTEWLHHPVLMFSLGYTFTSF